MTSFCSYSLNILYWRLNGRRRYLGVRVNTDVSRCEDEERRISSYTKKYTGQRPYVKAPRFVGLYVRSKIRRFSSFRWDTSFFIPVCVLCILSLCSLYSIFSSYKWTQNSTRVHESRWEYLYGIFYTHWSAYHVGICIYCTFLQMWNN